MNRLKVGILGTGNIGTDLLVKIQKSELLECVMFSGRNLLSPGMKKALDLGATVSDRGIEAFKSCDCELVFDATSAKSHLIHAKMLKDLGIFVVDMTPAKVGVLCVPSLRLESALKGYNVNMVTCGGQASIPLANAISEACDTELDYIETVSTISSKSAGPGTRANLDEYIATTELGLKEFTSARKTKAMINLNPASPPIDMQTTVMARVVSPDMARLKRSVEAMVTRLQEYVPGYKLVLPPTYDKETSRIISTVRVTGLGDYLPAYAGNLDIINCAAIQVAESYAKIPRQGINNAQNI